MVRKERSPGPAAYNIYDSVGKEAPAFSFGTMKRPNALSSSLSPGPVYLLKTSLGKAKDVTFKHNPTFGFGTAERPDPAGNKMNRTPGPGEYKLGVVVGPVKPPPFKAAPSFGFGTAPRLPGEVPVPKRMDRSMMEKLNSSVGSGLSGVDLSQGAALPTKDMELEALPGPGQYDNCSWMKKRPPAYSFGTSSQRPAPTTRANRVPGPGQYKLIETTGPKTALILRKGPSYGFGTAKLGMRLKEGEFPGPGSYAVPSAFDHQVASVHRTLPQFTFGTSPRETGIYD